MGFTRTLGVLLGLTISAASMAQFGAAPAELELEKVSDEIYVITNPLVPGNVTVLVTEGGVLLVDNKYDVDYDNIMSLVRSVTDQPVKYVINTHFHSDHSGSNALMQADGVQVIAADNARVKMIDVGQPGLPDITLTDHLRVYVGGVPVDAYWFGRSHTDGDVVVHFPQQRVVAMGDMFTHGEGLVQLIDYSGGGSARAWPKTIDGALGLSFDTVIPGHGTVTTRAMLEAFREDTVRVQEMVQQMIRAGRPATDIEAMLRTAFGWQDLHLQRGFAGLLVELE
jgi:cyclase